MSGQGPWIFRPVMIMVLRSAELKYIPYMKVMELSQKIWGATTSQSRISLYLFSGSFETAALIPLYTQVYTWLRYWRWAKMWLNFDCRRMESCSSICKCITPFKAHERRVSIITASVPLTQAVTFLMANNKVGGRAALFADDLTRIPVTLSFYRDSKYFLSLAWNAYFAASPIWAVFVSRIFQQRIREPLANRRTERFRFLRKAPTAFKYQKHCTSPPVLLHLCRWKLSTNKGHNQQLSDSRAAKWQNLPHNTICRDTLRW